MSITELYIPEHAVETGVVESFRRAIHDVRDTLGADNMEGQCVQNAIGLYYELNEFIDEDNLYIIRGMIPENGETPRMTPNGEPEVGLVHWWVVAWHNGYQWTVDAASLLDGHEWEPLLATTLPDQYYIKEINPPGWENETPPPYSNR